MSRSEDPSRWMLWCTTGICCSLPALGLVLAWMGHPLIEPWYIVLGLIPPLLVVWVWDWQRWRGRPWVELIVYFAMDTLGIAMAARSGPHVADAARNAYYFLPVLGLFYRDWRLSLGGGVLGLAAIWAWSLTTSAQPVPWPDIQALIANTLLFTVLMVLQGLTAYLLARREAQLVAERVRAEEQERLYRLLANNSADLVGLHHLDGTYLWVSPSSQFLLGYAQEELVGVNPHSICHPDDLPQMLAGYASARAGSAAQISMRMQKRNCEYVWVETLVQPILTAEGDVLQLQSASREITERKAFEEQLKYQAFHDPLTGLPNRALFRDRVQHAVERARVRSHEVAVLFLDLDDFKRINDSLGHQAGDRLLEAVGQRLLTCLKPSDTLARLGGDEFAILVEEVTLEAEPVAVAERALAVLRAPLPLGEREVFVQASIGIATMHGGGAVPEQLLRNADVAMYAAKNAGKSQYRVFDQQMAAHVNDRLELETDLRRAVERGELRLYYQPVVWLQTGQVAGFEALVRWQHPRRGLMAPASFIPLAEESDLILQIGWWVLQEAAHQARAWQTQYPQDPLFMSVNLSAKQLVQPTLVSHVTRLLHETGLEPGRLHFEITESVLMADEDITMHTLNFLRALGIQFAIDDFGTGYASMSYLTRFPVDALKIDRSFVATLGDGREATAVVESLLSLAKNLKLRVIGEGIETARQWDHLSALRCEQGQGYSFARPMTGEAADELLAGALRDRAALLP